MKNYLLLVIVINFIGCANKSNFNQMHSLSQVIDGSNDDLNELTDDEDYGISYTSKKKIFYHNKKKEIEKVPLFNTESNNNIFFKSHNKKKEIHIDGDDVQISVENIPIPEFIELVFSKLLKQSFTVSQDVKSMKKVITLNMSKPQSSQEVFEVVKKLLSFNGVSIKKEKGVFFISKKTSSIVDDDSNLYISYGRTLSKDIPDDENIMLFVPYYYINPSNSVNILRQVGIKNVKFFYTIKNIQMMKGPAAEIRKALEVIKMIDKPFLQSKDIFLLNLQNIDVDKFLNRIKTVFSSVGINVVSSPNKTGILLNSIPELNALLVISPKKSWTDMLMFWKNKLDIPSEEAKIPHLYIYKVKNRKADELAKAVDSIVKIKLSSQDELKDKKDKTNNTYSVSFDLPTNTIMMKMLPAQYREVLPLIEKLDALPLQVMAEVTLAEVTLTDTFSLGFEHALRNNKAFTSMAGSIVSGALTANLGGSGFAAVYKSKNLDTVINAYAEKKLLNILSKPRLIILNNKSGNINVGKQVPVITSETSAKDINNGTNPSILRNVKYRSTGITVSLSPTINSNGILTMKINLNLSEAQINSTSSIDSPLIVNRSLSTELTMKSGATVLLGGLISSNHSKTNSGVPVLKDVPVVGNLFKFDSKQVSRTELIMLIKPIIIKSPERMDYETKKYRYILKTLNQYSLF